MFEIRVTGDKTFPKQEPIALFFKEVSSTEYHTAVFHLNGGLESLPQ